jgi:tripartite-type tricarboxylate transporter receptor subunit TctC
MKLVKWTGAALAALVLAAPVAAQEKWPSKVVRLVSPFPPGGGNDLIARRIAQGLAERSGGSVIVENKPGAAGTIGSEYVARQPADGYTLLMGVVTTHAIAPSAYANLRYDPVKDFTPLTMIASYDAVMVAHPGVAASDLKQLLALAKSKPMTFASFGYGAWNQLAVELLTRGAGVEMTHVPYKGAAAAMLDLFEGRVDTLVDIATSQHQHVKNGKLKAMAVLARTRSPLLPDVPTFAELGYPGFESLVWIGMFAPAGLAPDLTRRISGDLIAVLRSGPMVEFFKGQGAQVAATPPEDFGRMIREDIVKWKKVMDAAGVKPQ